MQLPEESCRVIFFQVCFSRGDFLVNSTTNKDVKQEKKINVRSLYRMNAEPAAPIDRWGPGPSGTPWP